MLRNVIVVIEITIYNFICFVNELLEYSYVLQSNNILYEFKFDYFCYLVYLTYCKYKVSISFFTNLFQLLLNYSFVINNSRFNVSFTYTT